jgi:hypothetical protein
MQALSLYTIREAEGRAPMQVKDLPLLRTAESIRKRGGNVCF